MMDAGVAQEVLAIRQPEEMLILSGKGSVFRLCGILKRHPHGGRKNRGCQAVA